MVPTSMEKYEKNLVEQFVSIHSQEFVMQDGQPHEYCWSFCYSLGLKKNPEIPTKILSGSWHTSESHTMQN